jgi:mono/diheme cytochrome c family protein
MVERGRGRFNIYCSVCHGLAGYGDGMIVQRGFSKPPSFHTDELRNSPASHFFDVITQGFGAMPSYRIQTTVEDRWAIIAYIRALQLSQRAPLDAAPPDVKQKLEAEPQR